MRKRALLALAPLLLAAAGCDYGEGVGDGDPAAGEPGSVEVRLTSRAPAPTGTATNPVNPSAATGEAAPGDDPAAPDATAPSADCIDLSTGTPLLVPCSLRQAVRTAPVEHDDPDPWRPVANPATPSR